MNIPENENNNNNLIGSNCSFLFPDQSSFDFNFNFEFGEFSSFGPLTDSGQICLYFHRPSLVFSRSLFLCDKIFRSYRYSSTLKFRALPTCNYTFRKNLCSSSTSTLSQSGDPSSLHTLRTRFISVEPPSCCTS